MGFVDVIWHLLNFFAPAAVVGCMASLFAKLLWRSELKAVSWLRLAFWATAACALVLIAGLAAFGHDGKMATYALMVLGSAVGLWLAAWGGRRSA